MHKNKVPNKNKRQPTEDAKRKSKFRATSKWKNFSHKKKEEANWCCYICGVNMKYNKKKLHLHHTDETHYEDLDKPFYVLCNSCHRSLVERLVSRTKNRVDIDDFCAKLKEVYLETIKKNK
jgi:hypothetical protein